MLLLLHLSSDAQISQAQIEYTNHGWRIDDFFWTHKTTTAMNQSIALVHIDTNLLAYTLDTQDWLRDSCPNMKRQFMQYSGDPYMKWTQNDHINNIEAELVAAQDCDWIFVVGHHPVGGARCGPEGQLWRLPALFERHRVSAYLSGHIHDLQYGARNGVSYITSGAGGDAHNSSCLSGAVGAKVGRGESGRVC